MLEEDPELDLDGSLSRLICFELGEIAPLYILSDVIQAFYKDFV